MAGVEDRAQAGEDKARGVEDRVRGVEDKVLGVEVSLVGVEDRLVGVEDEVGSRRGPLQVISTTPTTARDNGWDPTRAMPDSRRQGRRFAPRQDRRRPATVGFSASE